MRVDGLKIGMLHRGVGKPVLLIHGLGGASSSWGQNVERFAQRFQVIAPDLPGFGRSSKPLRAYTPAFFASALVRLLDVLGVEQAHVVGGSLGGQVALELALRAPERVDRVVAVAPAGVSPTSFTGTPALEAYRSILDATTEQEVLEARQALGGPVGIQPPVWRSPREVLTYVTSPGAREAFDSALGESARARRLGPHLDRIDPPPLIVWGDADPVIPLSVCQEELEAMKRLQLAVFHGCGHSPQAERPGLFNDLVISFLEGNLEETDLPRDMLTLRDVAK